MPAKKQISKDMILDAALKLLTENGYEAVNIKRLAAELGCSTQPVYLSFSGMDELRGALVPMAVRVFEKRMAALGKDGVIRLYDAGYIYFAKTEPQLFCFLFMRANAFSEIKRALLPIIERSVGELMSTYGISREQADMLHDGLWMQAHGIASMIATDFCDWDMDKAEMMLAECKLAFTKKIEAQDVHE